MQEPRKLPSIGLHVVGSRKIDSANLSGKEIQNVLGTNGSRGRRGVPSGVHGWVLGCSGHSAPIQWQGCPHFRWRLRRGDPRCGDGQAVARRGCHGTADHLQPRVGARGRWHQGSNLNQLFWVSCRFLYSPHLCRYKQVCCLSTHQCSAVAEMEHGFFWRRKCAGNESTRPRSLE